MCELNLCKKCDKWKPNGGTTSIGAVYNNPLLSHKLGNCEVTGKLKNELNRYDCNKNSK